MTLPVDPELAGGTSVAGIAVDITDEATIALHDAE